MKTWRVALGYAAVTALAAALVLMPLMPLWQTYVGEFGGFRNDVSRNFTTLTELMQREGPAAVASAVRELARELPDDRFILFAGPGKEVLAGSLPGWPHYQSITDKRLRELPVRAIGLMDKPPLVVSQDMLPGGYRVLMARPVVMASTIERQVFYGIAGSLSLLILFGAVVAWLLVRRAAALRRSEERYERAMEASRDGIFDWDLVKRVFYVSPRLVEMSGLAPGTTFASPEDFMQRVPFHQEDREKWVQAVRQHFKSSDSRLTMVVRIIVNGETFWNRIGAVCHRNATGRVVRWTGSTADVTEEKRAEEALRESQERYERVIRSAQAGFWDWDVLKDEFVVSPRFLEMAELPPGTTFSGRADFLRRPPIHPEDWERWQQAVKQLFASGGSRLAMDIRSMRRDGSVVWQRLDGMCTRDAAGKVVRWTGSAVDINDRKLAEEALRESQERHERVIMAAQAGFWDWDALKDEFIVSPRLLEMAELPPGTTFSGRADFMTRARFHSAGWEKWQQAVQQLFAGGDSHLAMDLLSIRRDGRGVWYRLDGLCTRDAAGKVVRWTGSAVDIDDRKLAEEALRVSQERYALAVAGSDDGVWDLDYAARSVFISARARELAGMPPGPELVPMDEWLAALVIHPEDVERRAAAMQAHLQGEVPTYVGEFRLLQLDGAYRWRRLHGLCVRDAEGKPHRMAGSISDVDARTRAEDALRLSEERYALALEASQEGHFDIDVQTDQIFVSARVNEIYGLTQDARFGDRIAFLDRIPFHPDDRPRVVDELSKSTWEDRDLHEIECRIVPRPGEIRWIHSRAKVVRDAEGRARRRVGVVADITDRKLAEEALRESQDRFARAVAGSTDGIWDIDFVARSVYFSPRTRELCGLLPGPEVVPLDGWFEALPLHPEDLPRRFAAVQAHLSGEAPAYDGEFRFLQPDGVYRWRHLHGVCVRDAGGKPLRMAGSMSDVDDRRRAEEALRESQERYALALDAAEEGHFDSDLGTNQNFASARTNEIFGFPRQATVANRLEVHAKLPIHPDDSHILDELSKSGWGDPAADLQEIEFRIVPRPGEIRWIHSRAKVVRDAEGRPRRRVGVVADITDRKRSEEVLQLSEQRYALAMAVAEEGHLDWNAATGEFFASDRAKRVLNLPLEATYGSREEVMARVPYHPDDLPHVQAWRALLAGSDEDEFQFRILRGEEPRWIWTRQKVYRGADGVVQRIIGVVADVTEQKRAEGLLAGEKQLLELMARATPLATVVDALCRIVEENLGGFMCSMLLVDASGTQLVHAAGPSLPREYLQAIDGAQIGPEVGPCAMAASLSEQVISADLATETRWERWRALALSHGLRSCWSTPILSSANRPLGTFATYQRRPGNPSAAQQAIVERFTHLAAVAIERSRAEGVLRESEMRFRSVIDFAPVGIALTTRMRDDEPIHQQHVLQVNQAFTRMFGFAPEEAVGGQLGALLIPGEGHEGYEANADAMNAGTKIDAEVVRQRRDGTRIRVHLTGVPIRLDNKTACTLLMYRDLTERERATRALRESEARFRTLTGLSSDWYWTQDENMRFTDFSGRHEDWAGYPTATSVGKARWELEGITPMSRSWAEHRATLEARQPFRDFEYRRVAKNGEVLYATASGTPVFDEGGRFVGYQGVTTDITERKRADEALRDQTERLQLGQAAMRMIIMDWNIAEDLVTWSDSPEWLRGPLPASGCYPTFKDQVHPEDRDSFLATRCRAIETLGVQTTEFRVVRTDAEVIWVLERKHAFAGADGKAVRMLAAMFDITDRKRAEKALGHMEEQLRRGQRLEALGTLAGGIAHDFNNILGAILGYGEMALRNAGQSTRLRRDVDAIMAAGERGRALIDRILAFSRSGVGESVPVHVEAVVHEALDQIAAHLPDNVTIRPLLRAGRAAMLGDSTQVHQVVMNLATNAVQAMPRGGLLCITLQTAQLDAERPATVGSIAPGDYIVLEVTDTGSGIPNDVLERMFDPFFTTKEVGVGSGLGLSLVHGIVTGVGGAVDVDTRPGEGSRFTVYLRRSGDAPERRADEDRPLPRGEGQRVLVVDDEETLVRLATETLEDLGYAPISFTSSTAALAAFRADPARFDAVLTDERMPELSGSALIREVRGIRGAIPVILMSGYLGMESVDADVVVRKPVSARELAASMARALRA